jgi:predicted MFS family arabinose efflux permease
MRSSTIWTKDFTRLLVSNAFFFGGFHMLLPTVPLFASDMGGSKTQIGLIAGVFVFSSVITRLFTDLAVGTIGKCYCLLAGIVIALLSSLVYPLAPSVDVLLCIRLLHGVGFGLGTTFYIAIISDIIPADRRGEGLGYFGLATTLAMAVAPATGLWLAKAYGFDVMFLMSAGWEMLAIICLAGCALPGRTSDRDLRRGSTIESSTFGRGRLVDIFVEPGTVFLAILVVLMGIAYGSVLNFIALYATELGLANPGYFFISGTLCIFLSRVGTGRIYDRKGPGWIILPGAALLLGGVFLVAQTTSMTSYLAASAFYGLGIGMLFPALQAGIINAVAPRRRSAASATFSNALDLGLGGGSVLLGMYAEKSGLSAAYLAAAATMMVFVVIYAWHVAFPKGALAGETVTEEE